MKCRKCHTEMKPGKATGQTYTGGMKDFASDERAVTFSAGGPGVLIECMKCPACGYSVSK